MKSFRQVLEAVSKPVLETRCVSDCGRRLRFGLVEKVLKRLLVIAGLLAMTGPAWSAPPKVTSLFPVGAGRGQTTVMATGDFSKWPVQVWAERPGIKIEAAKDKGKLNVTVADDAEPGICALRFFNAEGTTSLIPFAIGTLKEVVETEPNDGPDKGQIIDGPATINGRLTKGDVDSFIVQMRQGQTLIAAVQANSELGSPMDSVMQVCSLVADPSAAGEKSDKPRFKEAYVLEHNDDSVGLDPRIAFEAPRDGWYMVRLFAFPVVATSSISFAGGEDFIYRLTLTTAGFLDHAFPMAATRDQSLDVELFGWNIQNRQFRLPPGLNQRPPGETALGPTTVRLFRDDLAGVLQLPIVEHANLVASDAKNPTAPQAISIPVTITGRIDKPRDRDTFRITATKGQKIRIVVESRSLGYDLDPIVMVSDANGKKIVEGDDPADRQLRDPDVSFTAAGDGEYQLAIRDTHQHGGFRYVYRMAVTIARPDYALTLKDDSLVLVAGKPLEIPITVNRLENLKDAVEVAAEGLPEGVTAEAVVSDVKGATAKGVKLILKADANVAADFQGPIRILGKSQGDLNVRHPATFTTAIRTDSKSQVWLTVTK